MPRALLTFTPRLSKRLIARAIAGFPQVQRAFHEGRILISPGTTATQVYRELTGGLPAGPLACGMITPKGACVGHGMVENLGARGHAKFWLLEGGSQVDQPDLEAALESLTGDDIFIKGANALDRNGRAAVMLGMTNGGTLGKAMGYLMARGVGFVVPVGLEKAILGDFSDIVGEMGIDRLTHTSGMPVGLLPVVGDVVTEIRALEHLAAVQVRHVGSGGVSGAEGSVALLVKGAAEEVEKVIGMYHNLQAEDHGDAYELRPATCAAHQWKPCMGKNILYGENVKSGR